MKYFFTTAAAGLVATCAAAHDPVPYVDSTIQVIVSAEETGGALGIFKETTGAAGGPPLHVHDDADETFYVMDGAVTFVSGGKKMIVEEGGSAFVPRGTEHAFRWSAGGGSMLVVLTPGGFEGFFGEVAAKGRTPPQDMPAIAEIGAGFELRFTGPPIAP